MTLKTALIVLLLATASICEAKITMMDITPFRQTDAYVLRNGGVEWLSTYDTDRKSLTIYTRRSGTVKKVAVYSFAKANFHLIESGLFTVRFESSDQPLFLFMLSHGNPYTSVFLLDPTRDSKRPVQDWVLAAEPQFIDALVTKDTLVLTFANQKTTGQEQFVYTPAKAK
jgi:hypothetical protein